MGRTVGLTHLFKKFFHILLPMKIYGVTSALKHTLGNRTVFKQ